MTKLKNAVIIAIVGITLLAGAWITDLATGRRLVDVTTSSEFGIYLVGLAYWTYTLPATVFLSRAMTTLDFEHYPAHVFPPPVTHYYPDLLAHQFTASCVATLLSIAFYIAVMLPLRSFVRKHPGTVRRWWTSLLLGYATTATLWPLVQYRSSPVIDTLRTVTIPFASVYRAFGETYPFTPGFAGATLPQFTYLSATHVVLMTILVFVFRTIVTTARHRRSVQRASR